jgi:small subunit ribosomal protein S3
VHGTESTPKGFRLGILEGWESRWFAEKEYALLHDDIKVEVLSKKDCITLGLLRLN